MTSFPPGLILIAAAAILALTAGRGRPAVVLGAPALTLVGVWLVPEGAGASLTFLEHSLNPVHSTAVGRMFATIFAIAAFAGALYALPNARTLEYIFAFIYAGSAINVTFSGDWISLLVWWEVMAIASTAVIWCAGTERSWQAGLRYLFLHLLGGVILMFGLAAWIAETGSVEIVALTDSFDSPAVWMILAGVAINAGAPPLWPWVADAYPQASPSGTVFLSAFTTKTAVYVLLIAFPGAAVLVPIGLAMIAYGAIFALLADEMRRLLSYSIVGQVGFMVVCIGIGTPLALDAAAAHAFAHILYKALLLMAAGSVVYMTGRERLSELGGLGRSMRLTALCALLGGLAIAAAPLTAGYASKSLISAALGDAHATAAWFGVMAASALALIYVGLRFPWFAFYDRDTNLEAGDPPAPMRYAMLGVAGLILVFGVFSDALYAMLPHGSSYHPYTVDHVLSQVELLVFPALVFFASLPLIRPRPMRLLDFDWFWRVAGARIARDGTETVASARNSLEAVGLRQLELAGDTLYRHHGPQGALARTWPSGSMVLWVGLMLLAYLIFYYLPI